MNNSKRDLLTVTISTLLMCIPVDPISQGYDSALSFWRQFWPIFQQTLTWPSFSAQYCSVKMVIQPSICFLQSITQSEFIIDNPL